MLWVLRLSITKHDLLDVRVVHGEEMVDLVGPVHTRSALSGHDPATAGQGLDPHEERACPAANLLGALAAVTPWRRRDRVAGVPEELVGLLIHAPHRNARVMRTGVDVEDVFHPGGELAVRRGWDGPALLQVRTKRPLSGSCRWWSGQGREGRPSMRRASPAV